MYYDPLQKANRPEDTEPKFEVEKAMREDVEKREDEERRLNERKEYLEGATPQTQQPQAPTAEAAPVEEKPKETKPTEPQDTNKQQSFLGTVFDALAAPGTGLNDYVIDELNKLPFINMKKRAPFKNDAVQALRQIGSFVIPAVALKKVGVKGMTAVNARMPAPMKAFGNNRYVKFLGEASMDLGAGAYVDYTNKYNESDDNLARTLKDNLPGWWTDWIPEDWATTDTDSPDVIHKKNVAEGARLGIVMGSVEGFVKFLKAATGTGKFLQRIPEDQTAEAFVKNFEEAKAKLGVEDSVTETLRTEEELLDEYGKYRLNIDERVNLDENIVGIDDVYSNDEIGGTRAIDGAGVADAGIDTVRIFENLGTTRGRLPNMVSPAALKYGLDGDNLTKRSLVKAIRDQVQKVGKLGARLPDGTPVPFAKVDKAGTRLSEILTNPRMEVGLMAKVIDEFKGTVKKLDQDVAVVGDVGYNAIMKSIKTYMDDYLNLDLMKAQAYLSTSLAGQVSDLAEGARLMDDDQIFKTAQAEILDRLEFLFVEKGLASHIGGQTLNFMNTWKRLSGESIEKLAAMGDPFSGADQVLGSYVQRAKRVTESLREINETRPDMLKPLMMAYEFTDGNIDTMAKLNFFVEQSLPAMQKAFRDNNPELPNLIVQGLWSNIYNSVLTSVSTPMKALAGNTVLMLERPIATMAGAALSGDWRTMRRGWYQYSAFMDTFQKGFKHMGDVFRKASNDPSSVAYIMRDDMARKNEETFELLREFAAGASKEGEDGPQALLNIAETLNDMGNNPILRFGANAMTAFDGFTRAVIANAEARGRAWDKWIDTGAEFSEKNVKAAQEQIYREMFDENGVITDKAVEGASREISLQLDTPQVKAFSEFIRRNPALRPFVMFPRTSANVLYQFGVHSPITAFVGDYRKLVQNKPLREFTEDELKRILEPRGLEPTVQNFNQLRAEIRGKKAIGAAVMMGAGWMMMNGNLRGNGMYDQNRMRTRRSLGWKPKTYRGWDGNWYSYEWLGPLGDVLAFTADLGDNANTIAAAKSEELLQKAMFIVGASITQRSMTSGLEPMMDVLTGNPAATQRWAANFASSLLPFSGARNEMSRIIAPAMRELNADFLSQLHNRNRFMDVVDPEGALPIAYDWIDGTPVGDSGNFWVNTWNAMMPMKVYNPLSEERQFLMDIEYDARPLFNKADNGVDYTPEERSQLFALMGQNQMFRRGLKQIMGEKTAQQWRQEIRSKQAQPNTSIDPKQYGSLYNRIDSLILAAKRNAERQLEASTLYSLRQREYQAGENIKAQRRSQAPPFPLENK